MSPRVKTALGLGLCVVVLVAWDIWLYVNPAPSDTISRVIADAAQDHPLLPFALGVLIGHWLWPLRRRTRS
jgi:hypothetical protein